MFFHFTYDYACLFLVIDNRETAKLIVRIYLCKYKLSFYLNPDTSLEIIKNLKGKIRRSMLIYQKKSYFQETVCFNTGVFGTVLQIFTVHKRTGQKCKTL